MQTTAYTYLQALHALHRAPASPVFRKLHGQDIQRHSRNLPAFFHPESQAEPVYTDVDEYVPLSTTTYKLGGLKSSFVSNKHQTHTVLSGPSM